MSLNEVRPKSDEAPKTLAQMFETFQFLAMAKVRNERQIMDLRMAFYAGAVSSMLSISHAMGTEHNLIKYIEDLVNEAKAESSSYIKDLKI